jgi:hypothetical protein
LVDWRAGCKSGESERKAAWHTGTSLSDIELTLLNLRLRVNRYPSRRFVKAVKRVRVINQKLAAFERGFISEGGIPEREWYRHLGVAPGKWLGEPFALIMKSLTRSHLRQGMVPRRCLR